MDRCSVRPWLGAPRAEGDAAETSGVRCEAYRQCQRLSDKPPELTGLAEPLPNTSVNPSP